MNLQSIDTDVADTVEQIKLKYLERRKQLPASEDIFIATREEAIRQNILVNRSKRPSKELKSYSKALRELFKAVSNHPDQLGSDRGLHGSNEDLSGDSADSCFRTPRCTLQRQM
ncbi:hypothetical protein PBY51_022706 [Eleginops maclovinus]|uniref:Uncharacterized protein n=1 Tax=Eleginops maclovinus TaxID=56733 RepID=A0AAN8AM56_ELEMC|nr:hypothetical protein PBY51_022706 [Eleginops maclovinus]